MNNALFFFNDAAATEIYTLSLPDALPIYIADGCRLGMGEAGAVGYAPGRRRLAARPPQAAWPAKPNGGPGHRPGPPFQGASRPAAAPPGVGILHRRPGGEGREGSQGVLQALEWRM